MSSFKQLKEKREARQAGSSPVSRPPAANELAPPQSDLQAGSSATLPLRPTQERLEANEDLQVRMTKDKGRGLFWCPADSRRAGRGTTLLRIEPEVTVASSDKLESMCHRCFSASMSATPLQRCSGCKVIRYCSLACQKAEWPAHKLECKALKAFHHRAETGKQGTAREPGTTVRLMGRLVWERKRWGDEWWGCIERLQTNRETIGSDEHLTQLPLRLVDYLGVRDAQAGEGQMKELGFSSAAELLDLVGRTTVNTFVAYSSDLTAVGAALSSVVAMINHSCVPNVAVVYPNGPGGKQPMHVVAIKDLEPGDELTTFYLDVSDPYPLRQKTLEQRYSFRCTCPLCTRVAKPRQGKRPRVDAREALWCGRSGCAGWMAASGEGRICTSCKQPSTMDVAVTNEALQEGREVLERVDKMMGQGDHDGALEAAQATVARLTAVQPPSAYPLLSLLRQLQTALILSATSKTDWREAAGLFEEAIRFHFLSIAGMQASQGAVFCEGHPARAIALATLSTLLVRQVTSEEAEWIKTNVGSSVFLTRLPPVPLVGAQRDQAGIALMVQAIAELKIAYGNSEEGGQPGRRLIEQVREWKESEAIARLAV